jgi:hypothetical protein
LVGVALGLWRDRLAVVLRGEDVDHAVSHACRRISLKSDRKIPLSKERVIVNAFTEVLSLWSYLFGLFVEILVVSGFGSATNLLIF